MATAKLPTTSVKTRMALAMIAGATTGSITLSSVRPGGTPRLCDASSNWPSNPRIAASVPM